MSRVLTVVPDRAEVVLAALRRALDGGHSVMPVPEGSTPLDVPGTVSANVALVVQSSGSTGKPKRVALSADALVASAKASAAALGGSGQWLLALPVHYIAGINVLVRSIAAGTEPVVVPPGHFDPLAFAESAMQLRGEQTFTSLVPAQLTALMATDAALETLRGFTRILVGGQSVPERVLVQALELGLNVTRSYGSSETSGGCVYDGVPLAGVRVRIIDGEVELAGPVLAESYLDDPERTARQFYEDDNGRWYRTSDAGSIIDGVLHIRGRLDDVIVSGGVKVSLFAVERVVTAMPGLADAVVVARPHERWGEVPVVVSTTSVSLERIRAAVGDALGAEARPAELIVVETMPRLASGKPDRAALQRRWDAPSQ